MRKKKPLEPQSNDWLFSCSATIKVEHIVATLGIVGQPITEFSALHWQNEWQLGNDIMRAYNYPKSYLYKSWQRVNWDMLNDLIFEKSSERDLLMKDGRKINRFVGETIIIRDCRKEIAGNLAKVVSGGERLIKHIRPWSLGLEARLLIILVGWTEPTLQERISRSWIVNPLPELQTESDSPAGSAFFS